MSKLTLEMARNLVAKLEAEEKAKKVKLGDLKPGDTFMIGEHEFIVLEQDIFAWYQQHMWFLKISC